MPLKTAPADSWTVTNYYKQTVYDPQDNRVGEVDDVLVDKSGKVTAFVIGVGGFLGIGEKSVAVPFSAVKMTQRDNKWRLTIDETKESLKNAVGFRYDRTTTRWVVDTSAARTVAPGSTTAPATAPSTTAPSTTAPNSGRPVERPAPATPAPPR